MLLRLRMYLQSPLHCSGITHQLSDLLCYLCCRDSQQIFMHIPVYLRLRNTDVDFCTVARPSPARLLLPCVDLLQLGEVLQKKTFGDNWGKINFTGQMPFLLSSPSYLEPQSTNRLLTEGTLHHLHCCTVLMLKA